MISSGEVHVKITDKWFNDNTGKVFWVESLNRGGNVSHNKANFNPKKILINKHSTNSSANRAVVEGMLHSENDMDWDTYTLDIGIVHDLAFKAIRETNTTARGIKIFG